MKTALLVIATGPIYIEYAQQMIESANKFLFPHDTILFTDGDKTAGADYTVKIPSAGFPEATLKRFHTFLRFYNLLRGFDYLIYSDADMRFVAPVTDKDIVSWGMTATEHPGYVGLPGTPETDRRSTAYCPKVDKYLCGGFYAGKSRVFLDMAGELTHCIDIDEQAGVKAIWNDESHTNRYFKDFPPTKILDPSFCYPEKDEYYKKIWERAGRGPFEPKLLALEKERP